MLKTTQIHPKPILYPLSIHKFTSILICFDHKLNMKIKTPCFNILILFKPPINVQYNRQKHMSFDADILRRTVKIEKQFCLGVGKCFYANIETVRKNDQNVCQSVIKIINQTCSQVGSSLKKLTEIRYRDKLIFIEDNYSFQRKPQIYGAMKVKNLSQPTKSSEGSNQNNNLPQGGKHMHIYRKKKMIFKKKGNEEKIERRNTKNVAKNFCKAFINYLKQNKKQKAIRRAKQIVSQYRHNNRTIEAIGKDSILKQDFIIFLKTCANGWINASKIQDKQIHKQAIQLYLSLITNLNQNDNKNDELRMRQDSEDSNECSSNSDSELDEIYDQEGGEKNMQDN